MLPRGLESVRAVFEAAMGEPELPGWLRSLLSSRLGRLLSAPARLPASVAFGLASRVAAYLATLSQEAGLRPKLEELLDQLYRAAVQGGYLHPSPTQQAR